MTRHQSIVGLVLVAACASCDRRPANLAGNVQCQVVDTMAGTALMVRVVFDSSAASHPAQTEVLPLQADKVPAGYHANRLEAGFGAADGSIHQCGGVSASAIRFDVTGQMASYPIWVRAYSSSPVVWVITDDRGRQLTDTLRTDPGTGTIRIRWRNEKH